MNRCAIADMSRVAPEVVVVKGDLTASGTRDEYQDFLDAYLPAFGERLMHVRGNHDAYYGETFAADAPFTVDLPGVTLAVLDTAVPRLASGAVTALAAMKPGACTAIGSGSRSYWSRARWYSST